MATELTHTITDEEIMQMFESRHSEMTPLASEDIAESIHYAVTAPKHVNVEELLILPSDQRSA